MTTLIKKKQKKRLIKINSDEHRLALTSSFWSIRVGHIPSGIDEKTANQRQSVREKTRLNIKKEHCFADDYSSIVNFMILILIVYLCLPISGRNNRYRYYSYNYCQRRNRFCARIPSWKTMEALKDIIPDETRVIQTGKTSLATANGSRWCSFARSRKQNPRWCSFYRP
jgi:Ca2+-transporting ATPase